MEAAIALIRDLMRLDPAVHLVGGWAEDAVLHGRATRPHVDVDVFVPRDELELRVDQAGGLGFDDFRIRMEPIPGRPLVVGALAGDLNLEYCIVDRAPGGGWCYVAPTSSGPVRVTLPRDALAGGTHLLEGVPVRTVTPLTLYQFRLGAVETFAGYRAKDLVAQAALRARFFADADEAELAPRVTRLGVDGEPLRVRAAARGASV